MRFGATAYGIAQSMECALILHFRKENAPIRLRNRKNGGKEMPKAKDLCWKCCFSRYYDELHVECINSHPLIHRDSIVECEHFKPKRNKRRKK